MKLRVVLSLYVFLLTGCAGFLNEGATGLRRTDTSTTDNAPTFNGIYFKADEVKDNLIKEGDSFSITLLSAHICDFRESYRFSDWAWFGTGSNLTNSPENSGCTNGGLKSSAGTKKRNTRGEITLLANAGESSSNVGLTMNPADSDNQGRVIYYNPDIRESGQMLNSLNLPIYGPKLYHGKNFIFELWMMELDTEEDEQTKALLASLAGVGAAAYPPGAQALDVLNTLGGAILSGDTDDLEFKFQMRFDVEPPANSNLPRLALAEGYYAFVREENRDSSPGWSNFAVNERDGVLCKSDPSDTNKCIAEANNNYRDQTWFLMRVAKEKQTSALDIEYGEEFNKFLQRLDEHSDARAAKIQPEVDKLIEKLKSLDKKAKEEDAKTAATAASN